jgi:hypothetical protein
LSLDSEIEIGNGFVKLTYLSHQVAYLIFKKLTHFLMELLLVIDLPLEVFYIIFVVLDMLRGDKRLLGVLVRVSSLKLW